MRGIPFSYSSSFCCFHNLRFNLLLSPFSANSPKLLLRPIHPFSARKHFWVILSGQAFDTTTNDGAVSPLSSSHFAYLGAS
jgi:hypothetical protein